MEKDIITTLWSKVEGSRHHYIKKDLFTNKMVAIIYYKWNNYEAGYTFMIEGLKSGKIYDDVELCKKDCDDLLDCLGFKEMNPKLVNFV